MNSIYLDHAAATPIDKDVFAAMQPYFFDKFYNPSSPYAPAVAVRRDYENAKSKIASIIGAQSGEITMTAGATESINMAFGVMEGHVITSMIEHQAVLETAKRYSHTLVNVDARGRVNPVDILKAVKNDTWLISIGIANSEIGTIQPLSQIAHVIADIREERLLHGNKTPLYLHTDASQGAGQLDLHVARLGVDLMTLNAAKIYGPKQVGLLYASRSVNVKPQIFGGGQEHGLRSGTENVPGVIGMAAALKKADSMRSREVKRLVDLRNSMQDTLTKAFPDAVISGHPKYRLAGHLHISFPGIDAERLVFALEAQGVFVATGSACAANKATRSHVLTAMGMPDNTADGSLRITLGRDSSKSSNKEATKKIIDAIRHEANRMIE